MGSGECMSLVRSRPGGDVVTEMGQTKGTGYFKSLHDGTIISLDHDPMGRSF